MNFVGDSLANDRGGRGLNPQSRRMASLCLHLTCECVLRHVAGKGFAYTEFRKKAEDKSDGVGSGD
jgi:hypothetical protein